MQTAQAAETPELSPLESEPTSLDGLDDELVQQVVGRLQQHWSLYQAHSLANASRRMCTLVGVACSPCSHSTAACTYPRCALVKSAPPDPQHTHR
jgi:hypothetical protein